MQEQPEDQEQVADADAVLIFFQVINFKNATANFECF